MIIIGLDYGDKRIGVAKSDPSGFLASGITTIEQKGDEDKVLAELAYIVESYGADKIVMGLPLNMDGSESDKSEQVRFFAASLQDITGLNVLFHDERLSTVAAHEILHMQGKKTGDNKKRIDMVAACVILQSYLDDMNKKKER